MSKWINSPLDKDGNFFELFKEGIRQMIVNEQSGGDGWWEGYEKLKKAYTLRPSAKEESHSHPVDKARQEANERIQQAKSFVPSLSKEESQKESSIIFPSQEEVENEFDFADLEVWGSNSGETGLVMNYPNEGDQSVYLHHIPSGKKGYVKLN